MATCSSPAPFTAGFNQAWLNFYRFANGIVFRPFGGLSGFCYPYSYGPTGAQNVNFNWNGPYNPSRYQ